MGTSTSSRGQIVVTPLGASCFSRKAPYRNQDLEPARVSDGTGAAFEDRRQPRFRRGKTHLTGRLCMEHDIMATNVSLPEGMRAGDLLIFCGAGGYGSSMSYVVGCG